MYECAPDLEELANRVIKKSQHLEAIKECPPQIEYLWCDKEKKSAKKVVYADTTKVDDKTKTGYKKDFIITFYQPCCQGLDDHRMEILMEHELLHVGWEPEERKCYIRPHDIGDFEEILGQYGLHWMFNCPDES